MQIVILLGAPGSGKGTFASRLTALDSAFRHVSSGDLLRDAIRRQTPAGLEADGYMQRGELVPDLLIARMIADLLDGLDPSCTLLLDGFPRTVPQAEMLDQTLIRCGATLKATVLFEVADSFLIDRIAGLRVCPECGAGYHVVTIQPVREGRCDVCGTALVIRKDDAPETVRHRLDVYVKQTCPLIAFYEARGLLKRVDGVGTIDEVLNRTRQAIA